MRTMTPEKLLKAMPALQTQVDTLLEFDVSLFYFTVDCFSCYLVVNIALGDNFDILQVLIVSTYGTFLLDALNALICEGLLCIMILSCAPQCLCRVMTRQLVSQFI